jgi:hypothetical protein
VKLDIVMNDEDILQARLDRKDSPMRSCPIWHAFMRCTEGAFPATLVGQWLMLDGGEIGGKAIPLPERARRFIRDFDQGKDVKPISFTVVI